jgi:hypothetical protein
MAWLRMGVASKNMDARYPNLRESDGKVFTLPGGSGKTQ